MAPLKQPAGPPIIDFTKEKLKSMDSSSWLSTSQEVVRALEEYGCFVAIYDKVSPELHEALFDVSKELHELPVETKVLNTSDKPYHGYVGNAPNLPFYEGLGISRSTTHEGVEKFTNLMWPSGNHRFSETILSYSKLIQELDQIIMRMVCERYGVKKEHYEPLLESMDYVLKVLRYFPAKDDKERIQGVHAHNDMTFTAIIHQSEVKGLEIKTNDGQWIPVDPFPSSFVVIAGDALMAWTNGRVKSVEHRVIITGKNARYSVGMFTYNWDSEIEVPEELVDEEHPLKFKPFDHLKFLNFYYAGKGREDPSKSVIEAYCGV